MIIDADDIATASEIDDAKAHSGILRAAVYVASTISDNNLLDIAFQKAPVSMLMLFLWYCLHYHLFFCLQCFAFPCHMWSLLNSSWTGHGHCPVICTDAALPKPAVCERRQQWTLNHIVNVYVLTKFEGRLQLFHDAVDETIMTTALLKWNETCFDTLFIRFRKKMWFVSCTRYSIQICIWQNNVLIRIQIQVIYIQIM